MGKRESFGMTTLHVEGVGFWANGLPDWAAVRAFLRDGALPEAAPARPSPALLPPNERRRAPDTVALALEVAQAACAMAGREAATLPSVFASTHGDLAITDYMCATLAEDPRAVSPTKFHNSVHNAAAGYWTIGTGCMAPTTAISAYGATFAQALLEAAAQARDGAAPVLLVAYDSEAKGPLGAMARSRGLLGAALVLNATRVDASRATLSLALRAGTAASGGGALRARHAGNAMAPMLPLIEALATGGGEVVLAAGPAQTLIVEATAWPD